MAIHVVFALGRTANHLVLAAGLLAAGVVCRILAVKAARAFDDHVRASDTIDKTITRMEGRGGGEGSPIWLIWVDGQDKAIKVPRDVYEAWEVGEQIPLYKHPRRTHLVWDKGGDLRYTSWQLASTLMFAGAVLLLVSLLQ